VGVSVASAVHILGEETFWRTPFALFREAAGFFAVSPAADFLEFPWASALVVPFILLLVFFARESFGTVFGLFFLEEVLLDKASALSA